MKNDPTSDMQFFVLVAKHGSLAAAARAIDLTPPAATKRLATLESRLGVGFGGRGSLLSNFGVEIPPAAKKATGKKFQRRR